MQYIMQLSNQEILSNVLCYLDEYSIESFLCCICDTLSTCRLHEYFSEYFTTLFVANSAKLHKSRIMKLIQTIVKRCIFGTIEKWTSRSSCNNLINMIYDPKNHVHSIKKGSYNGYSDAVMWLTLQDSEGYDSKETGYYIVSQFGNCVNLSKFPTCDIQKPIATKEGLYVASMVCNLTIYRIIESTIFPCGPILEDIDNVMSSNSGYIPSHNSGHHSRIFEVNKGQENDEVSNHKRIRKAGYAYSLTILVRKLSC